MLQKLEVHYNENNYDILLKQDYSALTTRARAMNLSNRKVCVVTDTNIAPYHAADVVKVLEDAAEKVVVYSFPAGEASKNLDTVSGLYEFLIREGFDRNDVLAALGGGVVGDLTGFTAATWSTQVSAGRPGWILGRTRIWWVPFICRSLSISIFRC